MKLPIRVLIPATLAALTVAIGGVTFVVGHAVTAREVERDGLERARVTLAQLQGTVELLARTGSTEGMSRVIVSGGLDRNTAALALADASDVIIAATRSTLVGKPLVAAVPGWIRDGAVGVPDRIARARATMVGAVHADPQRRYVAGFYPVLLGRGDGDGLRPNRVGVLFLVHDLRHDARTRRRDMLLGILVASIIPLALAVATWGVLDRRVTRRIGRLVAMAHAITANRLDVRSAVAGGDELGQLGEAFDRMAERLEHTRAEVARREAYFRSLIEKSSDVVLVLDEAKRIRWASPAARRVFGCEPEAVVGTVGPDWIPAEDFARIDRDLGTIAARESFPLPPHRLRSRDGSVRVLEGTATNLLDDPDVAGVVLNLRDVTEREASTTALAHAERTARRNQRLVDVGAISARIAHDVGNPVAGILMQTQLLERRIARGPDQPLASVREIVERIDTTAHRLDTIVREFKQVVREQRLALRTVALPAFLAEVEHAWKPLARARQITLRHDVAPGTPPLGADPGKLASVLDNLVKNAIEAIDRGPGEISVRAAAADDGRVVLTVEDTGPGIPPDIEPFRLFETTKESGTGLGLASCRQIVEAHHGTITCAPRTPHGTVFTIVLPRTAGVARDA